MMEQLQQKLKLCRLSGIQDSYERITQEARAKGWPLEQYFEALLDQEIINRQNHRFNRLLKQAKFPTQKTMDQFDFSKAPYLKKSEIIELYSCQFIENNTNVIFLGSPGTGKSHITIAIGIEACRQGKSIAFYTAANLGNTLLEMQEEKQLSKFIEKLKKVDLLIIDELGYVKISNSTSQLMFQIFSERYEKGSILVNTNLEFAEWANIFHDDRMTSAILDRLIHNSKILTFNGESYRYRAQKESMQRKVQ
ncbi:MAG: IS21-like element helper ATPase IstB [Bacteroidales bacterium]|nr:IS21-like element helper ATPase IstB [Bacteroidales bacterium]